MVVKNTSSSAVGDASSNTGFKLPKSANVPGGDIRFWNWKSVSQCRRSGIHDRWEGMMSLVLLI